MALHGINAQIWMDTSSAGTMGTAGTADLALISEKNQWTFDASRDFVETTSFGNTSKSHVAGLANASGDINGYWIYSGVGTLVKNAVQATTERAIIIIPDATNALAKWIAGKAFFSAQMAGGFDSAITYDIHFEAGPTGITMP